MKVTVLGCGTSSGVPMLGCDCPVCRSPDPRNRRLRCSILLQAHGQTILFDTGPDLREQMLRADVRRIDAIVYTHAHADHVHGIDDVRAYNNVQEMVIPAWAEAKVFAKIRERFDYAFHDERHATGFWRPALAANTFSGEFRIGEVVLRPFRQRHGRGESWGFRVGDFAYSTDTDGLDEAAFAVLAGVRVWIVDALREDPHPSHAHLAMTLGWIGRVRPERAFLTHMNHEVDYATWAERLPPGVLPAQDGLVVELPEP